MNKFIRIIREQIKLQRKSYLQLKELEWAHIFHDSIRGKNSLEELPLNIGRWAGNYAFFYVLHRILTDFQPKNILEFGLGESTKFISKFIENYAQNTEHVIIEHNEEWKTLFLERFRLSKKSNIKILNLVEETFKTFKYNSYSGIQNDIDSKYDLYVVDGPIRSLRYSRFDIVTLAQKFNLDDQFIILFDDYERDSEKETAQELLKVLKTKNISVKTKEFIGNKSILVIATESYKYITSV